MDDKRRATKMDPNNASKIENLNMYIPCSKQEVTQDDIDAVIETLKSGS